MAVDRFTRFKTLRALWTRARLLMTRLGLPPVREAQARAVRWQQVQVAERQLADGYIRGTGDPDSALRATGVEVRPPVTLRPEMPQPRDAQDDRARASSEAQRQQGDLAAQQWHLARERVTAFLQQQRRR